MFYDVLVVGGGLAGLRAAIAAHDAGVKVAVVSKVHPARSHSVAAQGGINAALANHPESRDDTPDRHAYDTIKGADFLADQTAVEVMTSEAPSAIYELEHWGCPFSRNRDGTIAQRPFGGAGYPRACYGADRIGLYILHTCYEQTIKRNIEVLSERFVVRLSVENGSCAGVVVMNLHTGEFETIGAKSVVFATGGAGRIYALNTTNGYTSTGHGMAVPFRAGVPLKDMEFIQFHPTGLDRSSILITEAARSEGAYLLNNVGERFMKNYISEKVMELGPRDIVARAMQTEINQGRGFKDRYLHLDLRHLGEGHIDLRLPGLRELAIKHQGMDPVREPIRVHPAMHYTMGGIDCDIDGATEIENFYAAGECACISVHGANRLGGNSLLETVVFGARAGITAARNTKGKSGKANEDVLKGSLEAEKLRFLRLKKSEGKEDPFKIREQLAKLMKSRVGIYRNKVDAESTVLEIRKLKERYKKLRPIKDVGKFNFDYIWVNEIQGNLDIALCIAAGAEARQESRGSHFRIDFNKRDDENWLKHSLYRYGEPLPEISYHDVDMDKYRPEKREY